MDDLYNSQNDFYDDEPQSDTVGQLHLQGVQEAARLWNPIYGNDPDFDWLGNKYPALKDNLIQPLRTKGFRDDVIDRFLTNELEPYLNFIAKPETINKALGRTDWTRQLGSLYDYQERMKAFKAAYPDKSEQDIFNAVELSRMSGYSTSLILENKKLFDKIVGDRPVNYKWIGYIGDPEWYKANPLWIGGNNYHYTREIDRLWYQRAMGKISQEEALKQDAELSKNILPEPAVDTGINRAIQGAAGIMTQGYYTGIKGWATGLALDPIGRLLGFPFGMSSQGADLFRKIGGYVAAADELWQLAVGGAYRELSQMTDDNGKPIQDEDVIRGAAALSGIVTVTAELSVLPTVTRLLGINKMFGIPDDLGITNESIKQSLRSSSVAREALAAVGKQYAKGVTWGTINNLLETYTSKLGIVAAQHYSGQNFENYNKEHPIDWIGEGLKTTWDSVTGFGISGLAGGIRGIRNINQAIGEYTKGIQSIADAMGTTAQEVELQIAELIEQAQETAAQQEQQTQTEQPAQETQSETTPAQETQQETAPAQETAQETVPAPQEETVQQAPVQQQETVQNLPEPLNADFVFVPSKDFQEFLSRNEGLDIQGAFQAGNETGLPRQQFEKLKTEHPEFTNTILNDTRYGAKAVTIAEAADNADAGQANAQAYYSDENQALIKQQEQNYLNAGVPQEDAEIASKLYGIVAASVRANEGVDIAPIEIRTAEQAQEQAQQEADMSRLENSDYDINNPDTWTDKQKAQELFNAAQGNLKGLSLWLKNILDIVRENTSLPQLPELEGVDENSKKSIEGIIRSEVKDYEHTLRTANQDAIDSLSKPDNLNAEHYETGSKFPRGRSKNPDSSYEISNYDGKTKIDLAEHDNNLYIKVKRQGVREPFTLAIKNFRDADFRQIISDLMDGVTERGLELHRVPLIQNLSAALSDFWSKFNIPKVEVNDYNIEHIQRPEIHTLDIRAESSQKPEIFAPESEQIQKPEIHSIERELNYPDVYSLETQLDAPEIHNGMPLLSMPEKAAENLTADQDTWGGRRR